MAHDKGILVIWDLSHSVGILAIDLNDLKVDFAVGCTYKYLNGGPGAPAFIYVNAKHHACSKSPIYGWMGHESPFKFKSSYKAKNNIAKFLGGTPCVLSLAALEGALEVYDHLETNILFQLREEYSTILINLLKQENLTVLTPSLANQKGGHVAFLHPHAYALSQALLDNNIIVDYREPDLIRMCINPLYINLTDLQIALTILKSLLSKQHYLQPKFKLMNKVT